MLRVVVLPESALLPGIIRPGPQLKQLAGVFITQAEARRGGHGSSFSVRPEDQVNATRAEAAAAAGGGSTVQRLGRLLLPRGLGSWGDYWFPAQAPAAALAPAPGISALTGTTASSGMLIVSAPPVGSADAVMGRLVGVFDPFNYRAFIWTLSSTYQWWGPKEGTMIGADGNLALYNWASDPSDVSKCPLVAVGVFQSSYVPPMTMGQQYLPAEVQTNAVLFTTVVRGSVSSTSGVLGQLPASIPGVPAAAPPTVPTDQPLPQQPPQWTPPSSQPQVPSQPTGGGSYGGGGGAQ